MGVDRVPLTDRARGRWRGILLALGIPEKALSRKHGPCPICRSGHDRFRFDDKDGRGTYICSKCGAGDGVKLVMEVLGCDFKAAAQRIEEVMGDVPVEPPRREQNDEHKREALNRLWKAAVPITSDDPAGKWLEARIGVRDIPRELRFAARIRYEDDQPSWHPAMIAMIRAIDGKPASLHRTYLTPDGQKADVPSPRRNMPGTLPKGAAVRLFEPGPVLGIAEGIETAFAAAALFLVPVWASLNSTQLAGWEPPAGTTKVIVFGDHDTKFGGQAAAFALAHRLRNRPDPVPEVEVQIPERDGTDWNDIWRLEH